MGILKPSNNIVDFSENFTVAIDHVTKKSKSYDSQIKNFKKIYFENDATIEKICDFLNEF